MRCQIQKKFTKALSLSGIQHRMKSLLTNCIYIRHCTASSVIWCACAKIGFFWIPAFSFFPVRVIFSPPFQWNLYLPLKIAQEQSSLRSSRNFSQYAKLCSQAPLWLSCDVYLRYANMTFLWLLFNPCSSSSLSLSARDETSPVHNITADYSTCLVQHILFTSSQVSGFHFHKDKKTKNKTTSH